ncbi:MAG: hypothetical protein H6672_18550 [Anaerolineaceae bacterium]|nr:hypothetical protein [Anaerolineaceae bacterium]
MRTSEKISTNHHPMVLVVSLVAGLGFILMTLSLGVGVIQGSAADANTIGLVFAGGLLLLILGSVSWFAIVQPHKHFDDINVPQYTGHHHEEHHDDHVKDAEAAHG